MMPRASLAKERGDKLDILFDSIGSGMIASRGCYMGPLKIAEDVKAHMESIMEAVLNRRDHNTTKASRDRMTAAIVSAMSKLIELSVREGAPLGRRIADKA